MMCPSLKSNFRLNKHHNTQMSILTYQTLEGSIILCIIIILISKREKKNRKQVFQGHRYLEVQFYIGASRAKFKNQLAPSSHPYMTHLFSWTVPPTDIKSCAKQYNMRRCGVKIRWGQHTRQTYITRCVFTGQWKSQAGLQP